MARVSRKSPPTARMQSESFRIWKTAIYVRLSVEDNGRDSDSIENQTELLTAFVEKHPSLEKSPALLITDIQVRILSVQNFSG